MMNDISGGLVLLPTQWEFDPFVRGFEVMTIAGYRAAVLPSLLAVQCGMGRKRAEKAMTAVLAEFKPDYIVSAGCCGGIAAFLRPGNICSALRISAMGQNELLLDAGHLDTSACRCFEGSGFSVKKPAAAEEKKRIASLYPGAMFVDMESYWIVQTAKQHNIPCSVLRVVVDSLHDPLPAFGRGGLKHRILRYIYKRRAYKGMLQVRKIIQRDA